MSDEQFRKDMILHITGLRNDVSAVRAIVENLRITVDEHTQLLRCVAAQVPVRPTLGEAAFASSVLPHATHATVPNRGHASSMMSKREIVQDFLVMNRGSQYSIGGDCNAAAGAAWEFFNRVHMLMRPKLVNGVLWSPSGAKVVMGSTNTSPECLGGISPSMVPFMRDDECVWVEDEAMEVMNEHGANHRVILATTLDGDRVVVDWGISQFSFVPNDIKLFIKKTDL